MIAVTDQIARALRRGKADIDVAFVLDAVRRGGRLIWRGASSASWWFPRPGVCEIMHVHGDWREADDFMAEVGADMRANGATELTYCGRPGWARFLERMYR